jgi:hypothetical protein
MVCHHTICGILNYAMNLLWRAPPWCDPGLTRLGLGDSSDYLADIAGAALDVCGSLHSGARADLATPRTGLGAGPSARLLAVGLNYTDCAAKSRRSGHWEPPLLLMPSGAVVVSRPRAGDGTWRVLDHDGANRGGTSYFRLSVIARLVRRNRLLDRPLRDTNGCCST